MANREPFFGFSVHLDDESNTSLGRFEEIQGFFIGSCPAVAEFSGECEGECCGDDHWISPRLIGFRPASDAVPLLTGRIDPATDLGNVWINVLDLKGQVIGAYFCGNAGVDDWHVDSSGVVSVSMSCYMNSLPEMGAGNVWGEWARRAPRSLNEWVSVPVGKREGWLEVARMYWRHPKEQVSSPGRREQFILDGDNILDLASFYCAIGEAMNGPGGYYGTNLSALDDCLFGGHGPAAPFEIVWRSSERAIRSLGGLSTYFEGRSVMDLILECFERRGVSVLLA